MTLVVGYADGDIGFMVGDTLLSHEHFQLPDDVGPVNGEFHSLKVQVLSGTVAVAYAGKFQEAYGAICEMKAALSENRDIDPVEWIANREGLDGCEFLALLNGQTKQLFRITDGKVLECRRAYIGLQSDYQRYTELRQPYAGPPVRLDAGVEIAVTESEKEFDIVSNAMEALSRDTVGKKAVTVGAISGCVIRVVDARISKQLEYMQAVEASHFPWEPEGGFTLLASNTETRGVGIYFRSGRRGFIMPVCSEVPCIPSRAGDLDAFIAEGRDKFGMELVGGKWQTEPVA
ncbi:hypothetical protein [Bradyrhizobium erythrophlei]|uniref:Uncharacterized protein n=1 Tax=Bradyrhizobium erythrophlei TaxID=1437360 RepID=A0A1M5LWP3_9BRAD|nr:hypothetical protein [Bradyrhizobium erythrophlei]SHG69431.1 hypothetical protein SAMN05444169_3700 [Bradyrhizobium erythrophlei]